jgi:hypothetical protein
MLRWQRDDERGDGERPVGDGWRRKLSARVKAGALTDGCVGHAPSGVPVGPAAIARSCSESLRAGVTRTPCRLPVKFV